MKDSVVAVWMMVSNLLTRFICRVWVVEYLVTSTYTNVMEVVDKADN
jgi:hypothetical protein